MKDVGVREMVRESCVLCAVKHIAQARALSLEIPKGYEEHYYFAMGHLAEAEDELEKRFAGLAGLVRRERKSWEADPAYSMPWTWLVLLVAHKGRDAELKQIRLIEAEVSEQTVEELTSWFTEVQDGVE